MAGCLTNFFDNVKVWKNQFKPVKMEKLLSVMYKSSNTP